MYWANRHSAYRLNIIMTFVLILIEIIIWMLLIKWIYKWIQQGFQFSCVIWKIKKLDKYCERIFKKGLTTASLPSSLSITLSRSLSTDISGKRILHTQSEENKHYIVWVLMGDVRRLKRLHGVYYHRLRGHQVQHHLVPWRPGNQSDMEVACPHKDPTRQGHNKTHRLNYVNGKMFYHMHFCNNCSHSLCCLKLKNIPWALGWPPLCQWPPRPLSQSFLLWCPDAQRLTQVLSNHNSQLPAS